MQLEIQSKHPHTTRWLWVEWEPEKEQDKFLELAAALEEIDFILDLVFPSPVLGFHTRTFYKPGSDLFEGWTVTERKSNLGALRRAFRVLELDPVPSRKLTFRDLI